MMSHIYTANLVQTSVTITVLIFIAVALPTCQSIYIWKFWITHKECLVTYSWSSNFKKGIYHTTTATVLRPFFRDHLGEPVPEDNFWTLWCKGRPTEADTPTIWLGATPSGLTSAHLHHPHIFNRLDALSAAQPTASKHLRQRVYNK